MALFFIALLLYQFSEIIQDEQAKKIYIYRVICISHRGKDNVKRLFEKGWLQETWNRGLFDILKKPFMSLPNAPNLCRWSRTRYI